MIACRTASVFAMGALLAAGAIGACREPATPEIPPLTTATPDAAPLPAVGVAEAVDSEAGAGAPARSVLAEVGASPVRAFFFDTPAKLEGGQCQRVLVAVVKGPVTAMGETLASGDVLAVSNALGIEVTGTGTVLRASVELPNCAVLSALPATKAVVRGAAAPKLEWARGTMSAHLDVSASLKAPSPSPELYLGRLEGTASVAEHDHPTSWEVLATLEASGSVVVDGLEVRLTARQIMMIPPGAKHAWRPDPGSKLVAIQMYAPPGPELRFGGLAAADKAAVKDAGARDAR